MVNDSRFARITVEMVEQVGNGLLTYQEFCALSYMFTFCGHTDGEKNPYMRGNVGIMETFQVSTTRAKRLLSSLTAKGFLRPIYRVRTLKGKVVRTRSLKQARHLRYNEDCRHLKTYYNVNMFPSKKPPKATGV